MIKRRLALPLLLVSASILTGCSAGGGNQAAMPRISSPPLLPTRGTSGITMQASIQGMLQSDGHCFWVGARAGAHLPVIWPHGYAVRTQPLRVVDGEGHVVGKVGDAVQLGGGEVPLTRQMLAGIPPSTRRCFPAHAGAATPQNVWFM